MNEIDCSDKDEWKRYVRDYIIPLRDSADALVGYWNYLTGEIDNVSFNEIETEKDENFKKILLGGIREDENYSERSFAVFYSTFFGARLSNLQEYLISQKEGVTSQVTVVVEESEFMKFVENIKEKTSAILESASQNGFTDAVNSELPEADFGALLEDPEKVIELVEALYNKSFKITVNYNQHTLFLWTIRKITRRYLEAAYPELQEEEKFDALKSFVGLDTYFEPEIEERTENDRTVKRDYTIWHLPDNSFGGLICGLNDSVWEYLDKESFRTDLSILFDGVVDLKGEFMTRAKAAIGNWKRIEGLKFEKRDDISTYTLKISGIRIAGYWNMNSPNTTASYEHHESNVSVLDFFDNISTPMFLGCFSMCRGEEYSGSYEKGDLVCVESDVLGGNGNV
jgi:hypothetical protein